MAVSTVLLFVLDIRLLSTITLQGFRWLKQGIRGMSWPFHVSWHDHRVNLTSSLWLACGLVGTNINIDNWNHSNNPGGNY